MGVPVGKILVAAVTTRLTFMQMWISVAPWSSGLERCALLQRVVPAAHEAMAASCTHKCNLPFLALPQRHKREFSLLGAIFSFQRISAEAENGFQYVSA